MSISSAVSVKSWELAARRPLHLVAVVAQVDAALSLVCEELGIRVEQVRYPSPIA
jgi:hypothetical protein